MTGAPGTLPYHLARLRHRVERACGRSAATPDARSDGDGRAGAQGTAEILADRFELSDFERDVILLAAFGELEPDGAALLAEAQGDARLRRPTVAFALSALKPAHWSAFAPDRPLRYHGLIALEGQGAAAQAIALPERVLHHLLGVDAPDELLLLLARALEPPEELPPTAQGVAQELARRLESAGSRNAPAIALCGPDASGKASVAAAAVSASGRCAFLADAASVPAAVRERALLARAWSREARLSGAVLVLDASEVATPAETHAIALLVDAIEGPVIVLSPEPLASPYRAVVRLDLPRAPAQEQRDLWSAALGPVAGRLNGTVERLGAHFTLRPGAIGAIGAEARRAAEEASDDGLAATVWAACRAQARPKLDELARRIDGGAGWDDIVLPARQTEILRALAAQVRQRATVHESWGFGRRGVRGLGINALFAGPSGTGKTLAAEILGEALDLDVYRIDLSAVVSKWIGETEKNLRRVFDAAEDGCAILLFDEADALFGKRSDVKDSHDRYANIEVSYLLQRMEAYRGLAILTTNLKSHLDDAFLRRIRFVVDFPFPGPEERREIWQRVFPAETPTDGLDWARLAQLNLSGGSIRNVALNAAFLAADVGTPVGMSAVRAAARIEYEKLGRPLTGGELAGWRPEADRG
jgi:hypothetical protein